MSPGQVRDEHYPLLLLARDDDERRTIYNKRSAGITSGAATIITQWPELLNTCCFVSACFILVFVTLTVMILTSITSGLYSIPNCIVPEPNHFGNKTIHLVHGPYVWKESELYLLTRMLKTYPEYQIHLINIEDPRKSDTFFLYDIYLDTDEKTNEISDSSNGTIKAANTTLVKSKRHITTESPKHQFFKDGNVPTLDSFLQKLLRSSRVVNETKLKSPSLETANGINSTQALSNETIFQTLEEICGKYPRLHTENVTYRSYFRNTPLAYVWLYLDEDVKIFAVRVLEIWQYGGISFSFNLSDKNYGSYEDKKLNRTNDTHEVHKAKVFLFDYKDNKNRKSAENVSQNVTNKFEYRIDNITNVNNTGLSTEDVNIANIEATLNLYETATFRTVVIDFHGDKIASKTPCHMFFEEILIYLRRNLKTASIDGAIDYVVKNLCRAGFIQWAVCTKAVF